jgi:hypothetical protein
MAACLARGIDWNGHKVRAPGKVTYVAAEGAGGLSQRAKAYQKHHGAAPDNFLFWPAPIDLLTSGHRKLAELIEASGGADLIVIDTLAQSMPGGDENGSQDMGKVIHNVGKLHRATGALVLMVHHCGKDHSRGARGWSGLRGAADAELEVVRDADRREVRIGKQKDGEDGGAFPFRLVNVDLGTDEDGQPERSCVVEYVDPATVRQREPKGDKQRTVLRIVREAIDLAGGTVPIATVLAEVVRGSADEQPNDARRNGRRALESLASAGFITLDDGQIALA